jgi:hypothetical protein
MIHLAAMDGGNTKNAGAIFGKRVVEPSERRYTDASAGQRFMDDYSR